MSAGLTPRELADFVSEWDFSQAPFDLDDDLLAIGADLEPGTIVNAYARGLFPMGLGEGGSGPLGWWSPRERGVLHRGALRVTKSLRKSRRRYEVAVDEDFEAVVAACADPSREGAWITEEVACAYMRLHELGIAHSVEVRWSGRLVGGLYGLALGGLFAGESMFHHERDASKVALWALTEIVFASDEPRLIDAQWPTEHLESLGVVGVPRGEYLASLPALTRAQAIAWPVADGGLLENR